MAPRSIWNGSIAFSEVVIPVKLFSAAQQHRVRFREVRLSDGSRITHPRYGSESGEEVPSERIRRAYETSPGHQVILTDEEIALAGQARSKTIEIEEFVKLGDVDPVYFDRPYILGPQQGAQRAYRVLHDALERTGKAGIGRFVMRTREQLITLAARDGALQVYTMHFADELVSSADLDVPELGAAPSAKEMTMAQRLIDTLAQPWQPLAHDDRYRDAVMNLVERKAAGDDVKVEAPTAKAPTPDLLAALQASIDQRGGSRKTPPTKSARKPPARRPTSTAGAAKKPAAKGPKAGKS